MNVNKLQLHITMRIFYVLQGVHIFTFFVNLELLYLYSVN